MRFPTMSIAAAAALALMCGAAQAGEFRVDAKTTAIGVGMICNTSDQAEQFVALRAGGAKARDALARVNRQAHDPRACGLAAIAFVPEKTLELQGGREQIDADRAHQRRRRLRRQRLEERAGVDAVRGDGRRGRGDLIVAPLRH